MLGWGVRDLARRAGTSPDTIARLERGEALRETTLARIVEALAAAGVELLAAGDGRGVILRPKGRGRS
jgi:transcriptional regulator with XRE-family HTH domain